MADTTEPDDPTLCTNPDAPGECCGGSFDDKSSPGLCAMCYMATKDAALAEAMKCTGCNTQLKLLKGARCRPCLRKDQPAAEPSRTPLGTYDPNQPDPEIKCLHKLQAEARRNAMQTRTLQKGGSKGSSGSQGNFKADHNCEKECSESLASHTALSELWASFLTPMTVSMEVIPKKILQGPSALKLPSPAIYLEGFISFENETGALAPYFVYTARENRKRKASQTTRTSTSELKRTRSEKSAPLPLRSEIGDLLGFSKIAFVFASVSVGNDGAVEIEWPNLKDHNNLSIPMCLLQDTQFDQDKTKMVYKVIYEGFPWVAKRFFDIGAGEGHVEIHDNREQLIQEAIRLGRTSYFLKKFIEEAKRKGVDIEQTSGVSMEQYEAACEAQDDSNHDPGIIIWLLEPR
ncbi:hypothetical protein B0H14DRAFT_2631342 [Mycena olivaceomarginata]|nr:hypothetical protein B0H14DRAFT_2631342 [Mycena olivaceomarginata]